jgi:P4 family phage/plasmid primase-like protien
MASTPIIQIIALRATRPGDYLVKGKQRHRMTSPPIEVKSHAELFQNLESYLGKIPKDERWNLFYTNNHCESFYEAKSPRKFMHTELLSFDVDHITDTKKWMEYRDLIADFLKVDANLCTVTSSGNGLHFLFKLGFKIEAKDFKKYQIYYKAILNQITAKTKEAKLPGDFDMIFDTGRIMRLPGTENRKPGKPFTQAKVLQMDFTPHDVDLKTLAGEPETDDTEEADSGQAEHVLAPTDNEGILNGCDFLRWTKESPTEVKEPQAYSAISILARMDNGRQLARDAIKSWTGSRSVSGWDVEAKIDQALSASGPRTCKSIELHTDKCLLCPYYQKIKSPISIQRPEFIATENTGFHKRRLMLGNRIKFEPCIDDLHKYLVREKPYKTVTKQLSYLWNGKKYGEAHQLFYRAFAEDHFNPSVVKKVIDEFEDKLKRYSPALVTPEWFVDTTQGYANFENGVLNTRTGLFEKHRSDLGFRYTLPFDFDANAQAPTWQKFLSDIFPGDHEAQTLLEEFLGYSLSGDRPWAEKILLLTGVGSNGKSTVLNVIQWLAGEDNVSAVNLSKFGDAEAIHQMAGKLVNVTAETPRKGFDEADSLKALVSGDTVTARKLYAGSYAFRNTAKIIFSCNEIPRVMDTTDAFYRRFLLLEFNQVFSDALANIDYGIGDALRHELPGIYNRVRSAYQAVLTRKKPNGTLKAFTAPKSSADAFKRFKEETDPVGGWIKDALVECEPTAFLSNKEIYSSFAAEMSASGHNGLLGAWSSQRLSGRVRKLLNARTERKDQHTRGLNGIRFKNGPGAALRVVPPPADY